MFCPLVSAEESASKFVRVPIFFLTDRNLIGDPKQSNFDFGPHRKYLGDCLHDPFVGNAYVVIENVDKKPITEALKGIGWQSAEKEKSQGLVTNTLVTGQNQEEIASKFYGALKEQCELTPDKNVFVFAHGYKTSFRSAAHTAAWLAYNSERPTVLYSWPSVAKLRSYSSDENNVEWSQEHFNDMIGSLDAICKEDPDIKIRLMAHSMGSRLLVRAIPFLREKPYLSDIDDGAIRKFRFADGQNSSIKNISTACIFCHSRRILHCHSNQEYGCSSQRPRCEQFKAIFSSLHCFNSPLHIAFLLQKKGQIMTDPLIKVMARFCVT
jgi:hypothetical protein